MLRKLTDIAHFNLRIRESLRRRLDQEAQGRQWSLNNEIRWRLEQSFERQDLLTLTDSATRLEGLTDQFEKQRKERDRLGKVIRAAEALAKALERNDPDDVKDAATRVRETIRSFEIEDAAELRHPLGGKS